MTTQGLQVIDHTVQVTHEWINELTGRLDWGSKRSALRLLRSTLQLVRDHLLVDEMAHLSAQLPLLVRGMFFEGWVPGRTPIRARQTAEFTAAIDAAMGDSEEYRGEPDIICVFDLLNAHLSPGEVADVRANLPEGIRTLWRAP